MKKPKPHLFIVSIFFLLATVGPIVMTAFLSFFPESGIEACFERLSSGTAEAMRALFSQGLSFEQYRSILLASPDYLYRFWNSVGLVVPVVFGQLAVAVLASYGFSMLKGRAFGVLFACYLILMMLPYQVTVIPNYYSIKGLGLLNSNFAIWLPGIFSPFAVYLLSKYMKRIDKGLIEAARIDGAKELAVLFRVVVPSCKGHIFTLGILIFIDYWNQVELPLVMFTDPFDYPLSVFLSTIQKGDVGVAFAASVIYLIPVLLLSLFAQKELEEGLQEIGNIKM